MNSDTQRKITTADGKILSIIWATPSQLLIETSDPQRNSHGIAPIGPVTLHAAEIDALLAVLAARPGQG